jgi:FHS family Na+ dependent glucose MFS transporter 1
MNKAQLRLGLYYVLFLIIGLNASIRGPLVPFFVEKLNFPIALIGLIFPARSLGYLFGTWFFGKRYDTHSLGNGHSLLALSLLITALFIGFLPWIPMLGLLLATILASGFMESSLDVGSNTFIVWDFGNRSAPYISALHTFYGFGAFIGPALVAILIAQGIGSDMTLPLIAVSMGLLSLFFFLIPAPHNPGVMSYQEADKQKFSAGKFLLFFIIFLVIYAGAEIGFVSWLYSYTLLSGFGTEESAGYLNSIFWGSFTLGRVFSVYLTKKYPSDINLLVIISLAFFVLLAMILLPQTATIFWIGTIIFGMLLGPTFSQIYTLAMRALPGTAKVMSMFFLGIGIGATIFPLSMGFLFENIGHEYFLIVELMFFVMLLIFTFAAQRILNSVRPIRMISSV